jgi:chorismate synthase
MNGNRFGTLFQVTTWGESHGRASGAVVDGCPSALTLSEDDFAPDMARRQGGGSSIATPRREHDRVEIESGVFEGRTLGTPISLRIANGEQKSEHYDEFRHVPRPGHADLTTHFKHGHRDHRGGGRSSARETAARVAAGVVAKKILAFQGIELAAWLCAAGPYEGDAHETSDLSLAELRTRRDANELGAPYSNSGEWAAESATLRDAGDSWGGRISCRVDNLPAGIGEPVFDKLGALLAHAMMSLPAAVAFEAGGGLAMSRARGSEIRDAIARPAHAHLGVPAIPVSNRHGGLLGGMTSGLPLLLSVAFHGPTSVPQKIASVNLSTGASVDIEVGGRHDAFPLPRALVVVEAMAAITIVDALLRAGRIPEKF